MKQNLILVLSFFFTHSLFGQASGNINYQNQVRIPNSNINVSSPSDANLLISVKGLANVKADSYVAIVNVTQIGKTTEEVNRLIDSRINKALEPFKAEEVESYVDMLSFVPIYEYEVDKKIFSKNTYNEVPVGFELKKNIHLKYTNTDILNKIISVFADAEIYDLVKVDYFSYNLEHIKKELMARAKSVLNTKLENYETILNVKLDTIEKHLSDEYRVLYPLEMYKTYNASNSYSLDFKKSVNTNQAKKATTLYYQPIIDKEFDFIVNPTILEPVIQVLYHIKLVINREKETTEKVDKKYILITPNGDIKNLKLE
ncbi:SIMPL domain-containing protein [Flammeovirgaceae bacterium SG7u.132]|nr:SIMPL domain-containing protein [Flammeovirgaceae bacterium SG7u.132]